MYTNTWGSVGFLTATSVLEGWNVFLTATLIGFGGAL